MRQVSQGAPDIESDPALREAYHSLQLYWMRTVPGYREEIKRRVAAAAIKAHNREKKMDAQAERDAARVAEIRQREDPYMKNGNSKWRREHEH